MLTRILTDEVGHVELGSYWFKFVCLEEGWNPRPNTAAFWTSITKAAGRKSLSIRRFATKPVFRMPNWTGWRLAVNTARVRF
ncbi:MAG: hypothetical protein ACR65O_14250 [Methylomicrobium sp.]